MTNNFMTVASSHRLPRYFRLSVILIDYQCGYFSESRNKWLAGNPILDGLAL
jgi:hypothetical protein